jgi:hypothetical protein
MATTPPALNPPPPAPVPPTKDGGFADPIWQRWFQSLFQAVSTGLSGLYVLINEGTLQNGKVITSVLESCSATGGLTIDYALGPGESDNNAASTQFVTQGSIGGSGTNTAYLNVVGSRMAGTTYVGGDFPLCVSVEIATSTTADSAQLVIGGDVIAQVNGNGVAGARFTLFGIVPPSNQYKVLLSGASGITTWFEF